MEQMTAHQVPIKVRFYELDPYNHLNHAAYIQYFEVARIELLAEIGVTLPEMMADGLMIVVTDIATRFLGSARSGDEVVVETELIEARRVTARWRQRIMLGEEVLATQEVRAAITDLDGRPRRFPSELIEALERFRLES
jgi:acyl-CoA thioester hydrolase